MNTNKIFGVLLVIALVLSGFNTFNKPKDGKDGKDGFTAGAISTLDGVDNPYISVDGAKVVFTSEGLVATSSIICSIKNPYNATSTVLRAGLNVTSNPLLAASAVSLSTSTTAYATSSAFFVLDATLPLGVAQNVYWLGGSASTTNTRLQPGFSPKGESLTTLKPGEFLNWGIATTTTAGALASYLKGSCSAWIATN